MATIGSTPMSGECHVTAYAHSLPGRPREEWQPLEEHLRNVAKMAAEFAGAFGSQDWAWNAGWLHDVGKIAPEFQAYLARENNLDDSEYDVAGGGRVNHSSAGAALAEDLFGKAGVPLGLPLAYLAAGHHAGLPDWWEAETGRAALRMRLEEGRKNLDRIGSAAADFARNLRPMVRLPPHVKKEQFHLWTRMLFSGKSGDRQAMRSMDNPCLIHLL